MISEIFLHVGLPKTATSSIQNTLFSKKNSKFLEENDYFYPKHWPPSHNRPIYSNFCDQPEKWHANKKKKYSIKEIKKSNEAFLHSIEKDIKETTCTKLIISSEGISNLTSDNLLNLRNYFLSICGKQVKFNIIIYVRNPISLLISTIQQRVKGGHTEQVALKSVMKKNLSLFQEKIEKFSKVFGSESVKIYSFEEAIKHEFGPVGYFLALLNVNNDEISRFHYKRSNEGLSMFSVKFLSYVNMKMPLMIDGKLQKNRTPRDSRPLFNIHGPKYDISYTDKTIIIENSRHDVDWLRKNYGIDYSSPSFSKNQNNIEITEKTIHDLKNTFQNLSRPFRLLLIEFLQLYADSVDDEKNKISILNLIHDLKKYRINWKTIHKTNFEKTGLKIISKILPKPTTDKIVAFYVNKRNRAR